VQKAIEGALQRPPAGEVLPAKGDPPVLVQDRFLQALHKAIGPGVARLRLRDAQAQALTARGKDALEFLPVVPSEKRS
jgi:hypothetical protein